MQQSFSVFALMYYCAIKTVYDGNGSRCTDCSLQMGQLETELAADRESLQTVETLNTDLMKEKALFEKTLETLRENSERQVQMWRSPSRFEISK